VSRVCDNVVASRQERFDKSRTYALRSPGNDCRFPRIRHV